MRRHHRIVAAGFLVVAGITDAAAGLQKPPFDLEVVDQEVPSVIETGADLQLPVRIVNNGTESWSSADGFYLAYHWLDEHGEAIVWDGHRTAFGSTVHTGDQVSLQARVEAPRAPGRFVLVWDIVHEGELWLSEVDPTPPTGVMVDAVVGHAFSIQSGGPPRVMVVRGEAVVRLSVRNDGSRTWTPGGAFALSYHWLDDDGSMEDREGRRGPVAVTVAPGETADFSVAVAAPGRPGLFSLQWDMVEEGVCWFSDRAVEPLPSHRVLVVTDVFSDPVWWAILCLLAAGLAVMIVGRGGPRVLVSFFAVADVFWCAGSLVVKQGSVLATAGSSATSNGRILMAAAAAALGLVVLLLPDKSRRWACWLVAAIGALLLWGDTIYVRFFGDLPGLEALAGVGQLGTVGASVRSLLELRDVWLFADLLPGLVLVIAAFKLGRDGDLRPRRVAAVALAIVVVVGAVAAAGLARSQPLILQQVFRRTQVAEEIGVLNLHTIDLVRKLTGEIVGREISAERYDKVSAWFRDRAPLRAGTGPSFGAAAGFNLIMIQVESLQGFVIGLEVGGREVTPFLNRWAEDSMWFSNVTDQTAQGRSSDSELATQVSLLPLAGGAAAFRFAGGDFTGLAEILAGHGYRTLSAVPFDGAFWNRSSTHPAYGYAESLFEEDFAAGDRVGWGLSDRDFLDQVGQKLTTIKQPFAAYLLTLSLHHPFEGFPQHLEVLDVGRWQGTPFGNFLHTMHFFDTSLASFVAGLERSGLADTTVIAVWGDHDAGFPWRPEVAAAMSASHDPEGWYLSQEVPLVIHVPGAEELRGERDIAAGHVDVAPTLLPLLGVDPAPYAFVGRNLLGAPGDPPVVGEYGCWRNSRLLFLQGDGTLEDGVCIDLPTMEKVSTTSCAEGFDLARTMSGVSMEVLQFDLQERLHEDLMGMETAVR